MLNYIIIRNRLQKNKGLLKISCAIYVIEFHTAEPGLPISHDCTRATNITLLSQGYQYHIGEPRLPIPHLGQEKNTTRRVGEKSYYTVLLIHIQGGKPISVQDRAN